MKEPIFFSISFPGHAHATTISLHGKDKGKKWVSYLGISTSPDQE